MKFLLTGRYITSSKCFTQYIPRGITDKSDAIITYLKCFSDAIIILIPHDRCSCDVDLFVCDKEKDCVFVSV